jgi:hypothetical protein
MKSLGMVSQLPEVIRNTTSSSIIHAIRQAYASAQRIASAESPKSAALRRSENYLLIITFRDMYLGNGRDYYESVAKGPIDKIIEEFGGVQRIPVEHIYFLSIEDLDLCVECLKSASLRLTDILRQAVRNDKQGDTKRFNFSQHLNGICPNAGLPKYLDDEVKRLIDVTSKRVD